MMHDVQAIRRPETRLEGKTPVGADQSIDFNGLNSLFGFQIGILHAIITTKLEVRLRPLGLSPKLASVLWLSDANPGIPQLVLTRLFGVNRTTINAFVRDLRDKNLIYLEQSENDKRVFGIHLTEEGKRILPVLKAIVIEFEREFERSIGANSAAMFNQLVEVLKIKSLDG